MLICKCSIHAGSRLSCSQDVTPRVFTEETKSTSEFPIRIEEGRGKLTDNLCDFTSIDSVLLSFNWSLLYVIHNLTSVIQFCRFQLLFGCDWGWFLWITGYRWQMRGAESNVCWQVGTEAVCTRQREQVLRLSPGERPNWGELRLIWGHQL